MTPSPSPLAQSVQLARLTCRSWGATDVGLQRSRNEDAYYLDNEERTFIVIDGMGGAAAGDLAAAIVQDALVGRLRRRQGTAEERIREGIALGNNAVVRHAETHPERSGMGCVLTAAVVESGHLVIGHVGDTRLYRIMADGIEKLTRDHSPVGAREDLGELTEAEAMLHPGRAVVNRALGGEWIHPDDPFIDVRYVPLTAPARFLLCTDGITDQIASADILKLVSHHPVKEAVCRLLEKANHKGGSDNATAIIVDIDTANEPSPGRADAPSHTEGPASPDDRS